MRREDFIEKKKLEEIVEKISCDVDSVIVEGWADKKVIQELGFEGKIFLSAERTHEDLIEDISRGSESVAVLTDFDSHGKEEAREISRKLQEEIDVIRSARKEFGAQLTSKDRRAVEDIKPLFDDLEEKFVEAAMDGLFFRGSD
jgi:5S rRNA maturation endonuclease (ribonuclease M5)